MSVRSFVWSLCAAAALFCLSAVATPVLANSCGFGCQATFIAPPLTGSLSSCTTNTQCSDFCSATCGRLGTSPRAVADAANPSTCSSGACTPCTCTPQLPVTCNGTDAAVCQSSCNTTCAGYNASRPQGVASIVCAPAGTPAAPRCVDVPAPTAPAGSCRFACAFGANRPVRTETTCTPSSPSECTSNTLDVKCTELGLEPTPQRTCVAGGGGNKCVISCRRPTAVSATDRGACNAAATAGTAEASQCSDRCNQVCGNRGMVCNTTTAPRCTGSGSSGQCEFSCAVAPASAPVQTGTCDAAQGAASVTACTSRCTAYCSERGGTCDTSTAPTCVGGSASTGNTGTSNMGNTGNASRQPVRTAPVFSVTFPDPFGGNLTLQQIIGSIIRILIGLCGVFFLGVFVYGGLLYLTSAGEAKSVQKGQAAIVNAVIGLVVVLFAYVAVSLIIQVSDQLQTGDITGVDQSQNARDEDPTSLQPGGTTRATGRSSQGTAAPGGGPIPAPEAGTPGAACRAYYGADPATCAGSRGGPCPDNVNDLGGLMSVWGRNFPAPTTAVPDPAAACRTCLQDGVRGLQGANPGLTTSCIPALVRLWTTSCHTVCNAQAIVQSGGPVQGADLCEAANYNTGTAGCARCRDYWTAAQPASRATTIAEVGCPTTLGKALVWCAGAESPSQTRRPQSGGYCVFSAPRR